MLRKTATRWFRAVIRRCPAQSRGWGEAMLREADFVERDGPALLWLLGGTAALCRHSLAQQAVATQKKWRERLASNMLPLIWGIAASGVFMSVCAGIFTGLRASGLDPAQQKLADRLLFLAIPETVYLAGVAILWRRRKAVAVGIFASGVLLLAHVITHVATHARI